MTDKELIARLRQHDGWVTLEAHTHLTAADRIEALVKERDEARTAWELEAAALKRFAERHERNLVLGAETRARAERLEAALKWQAEQPEAHPFMVAHALAALKGEFNE